MGRYKEYLKRDINFGKKGEISREIAETLIKESGKTGFSNMVRKALIACYLNKKEFNHIKINKLLYERKELKSKIPKISKKLQITEKQLNKLGYKLKGLE